MVGPVVASSRGSGGLVHGSDKHMGPPVWNMREVPLTTKTLSSVSPCGNM